MTASKENDTELKVSSRLNVDINEFDKISELISLEGEINKLTKREKELKSYLKTVAENAFVQAYDKHKVFVGSIKIVSSDVKTKKTASFLFVPQDKYASIDRNKANELKKQFKRNIVDVSKKYVFNNDVIERNQDIIAELIMNSDKISAEDKLGLLEEKEIISVKKGVINNIFNFMKKTNTVSEVIKAISPVYQLRSFKIK